MKTKEQILAYVKKHNSKANWEIAKNLRRHGVTSAMIAEARVGIPVQTSIVPKARIRVRSIADFRKAHDIPQKIRDQITSLRDGGYVTEEELRQLCEVPVQGWRRNAELPEFSECKLKCDGITYWAQKETVREMKRITGRA